MTWNLYKWTWQLKSPLYVGMPPAGSINRCRLYIPARAMWGALTAELARHEADGDFPGYKNIGDSLHKNMRFTYLYPAERQEKKWKAWLPAFSDKHDFRWRLEDSDKCVTNRSFRRMLLHTRPGTSIDPSSDAAESGSLRETEYIQARWPDGSAVAMVGYVLADDNKHYDRINIIKKLFIGGDTRYGLGALERISMNGAENIFGHNVNFAKQDPIVESNTIFAHGHTGIETLLCGEYESLQGWDLSSKKLISDSQRGKPYLTPGSHLGQKVKWEIGQNGIWHEEAKS